MTTPDAASLWALIEAGLPYNTRTLPLTTTEGVRALLAERRAHMEEIGRLRTDLANEVLESQHWAELAAVDGDLGANPPIWWKERATAAEARVTQLEEALRPFANAGATIRPEVPDTHGMMHTVDDDGLDAIHFRRALAALAETGGKDG